MEENEMPTSDASPIRVTGVVTVGIPVRDQDSALEFYVGVLGLEKRLDAPTPGGGRWLTVAAREGTGTTLALVLAGEGLRAGVDTGIRLATADAEAAHAALRASGMAVDEILRWPGVPPMFSFRDPDGNRLEMVEVVA
jgi:lactoylglutathione lyase